MSGDRVVGGGNAVTGVVGGNVVQAGGDIDRVVIRQEWMPFVMPGSPAPRALPPLTPFFTDRQSLLERLVTAVRRPEGGDTVVVLHGPGGIGKSATTVKLATLVGDLYPDGQLYVNLRGASAHSATTPAESLRSLLLQLRVNERYLPTRQDDLSSLFRSLVAERRVLVVLDDAHSAAQVRPLVSGTAGSLTVVTSRFPLARLVGEFGARSEAVRPLEPADGLRLLARFPGVRDGLVDRGAEAVVRRCGGMPQALCTAGARFATEDGLTPERLTRELDAAERPDAEEEPVTGAEPQDGPTPAGSAVPGLLRGAYAVLSPEAARAHRVLALHPWSGFGPELVGAAAGLLGDGARERGAELAAELAEKRLLEPVGEGQYRMHDEIRRYAEEESRRVDRPGAVNAATRGVLRTLLAFAVTADARVTRGRWYLGPLYRTVNPAASPYPDEPAALAALARERENLVTAVAVAEDSGFDELAWQLCEALWGLFLRLGFHQDWVRTHQLGVEAAVRCGDLSAEGRMRCQLAFAHLGLGAYQAAEDQLRAARVADEQAGHAQGEATAWESLALVRLRQGRPVEARECLERARERAVVAGDARALALLDHHLGRALRAEGRYPEALEQLRLARASVSALSPADPYNEARVLTSVGEALLDAGRAADADAPLGRAAEVMTAQGATVQRAEIAALRARCAELTGDGAAQRRYVAEAVEHHRALGSPALVAWERRWAELDARRGGAR